MGRAISLAGVRFAREPTAFQRAAAEQRNADQIARAQARYDAMSLTPARVRAMSDEERSAYQVKRHRLLSALRALQGRPAPRLLDMFEEYTESPFAARNDATIKRPLAEIDARAAEVRAAQPQPTPPSRPAPAQEEEPATSYNPKKQRLASYLAERSLEPTVVTAAPFEVPSASYVSLNDESRTARHRAMDDVIDSLMARYRHDRGKLESAPESRHTYMEMLPEDESAFRRLENMDKYGITVYYDPRFEKASFYGDRAMPPALSDVAPFDDPRLEVPVALGSRYHEHEAPIDFDEYDG